jgi:hypothetical protein
MVLLITEQTVTAIDDPLVYTIHWTFSMKKNAFTKMDALRDT